MSDLISVAWNEFKSSAISAFKNLEGDKHFTDVTLACGAGGQIQAHKVVLSSCSSFFRDILIQNPHPHPLIYLVDVELEDLKIFIKFIYSGEAAIEQEKLEKFMKTARRFQVKGLGEEEAEVALLDQSKDEEDEHKTPDDVQDEVEILPVEEEEDVSLEEETLTDILDDKVEAKNERVGNTDKGKKRKQIEVKEDAIGNETDDKTKDVDTSNTENESGDVESDNEASDDEEVENEEVDMEESDKEESDEEEFDAEVSDDKESDGIESYDEEIYNDDSEDEESDNEEAEQEEVESEDVEMDESDKKVSNIEESDESMDENEVVNKVGTTHEDIDNEETNGEESEKNELDKWISGEVENEEVPSNTVTNKEVYGQDIEEADTDVVETVEADAEVDEEAETEEVDDEEVETGEVEPNKTEDDQDDIEEVVAKGVEAEKIDTEEIETEEAEMFASFQQQKNKPAPSEVESEDDDSEKVESEEVDTEEIEIEGDAEMEDIESEETRANNSETEEEQVQINNDEGNYNTNNEDVSNVENKEIGTVEEPTDEKIFDIMSTMTHITITRLVKPKIEVEVDEPKIEESISNPEEAMDQEIKAEVGTEDKAKPQEIVESEEDKAFMAALSARLPPNQCDVCFKVFTTSSSVQEHKLAVHEKIKFPCDMCKWEASSRRNLRGHIQRVHTSKDGKGSVIKKEETTTNGLDFISADDMKKLTALSQKKEKEIHLQVDELIKVDTKPLLDEHEIKEEVVHEEDTENEVKQENVEDWKTQYERISKDVKEKAMSLVEQRGNMLTCTKCGKSLPLSKKWNLLQHVELHMEAFVVPCPICGLRSKSTAGVAQHREKAHPSHPQRFEVEYECKQCDHKAKTVKGLYSHKYRMHPVGKTNSFTVEPNYLNTTNMNSGTNTGYGDIAENLVEDTVETKPEDIADNTQEYIQETVPEDTSDVITDTTKHTPWNYDAGSNTSQFSLYTDPTLTVGMQFCDQCGFNTTATKILMKHRKEEHPGAGFFCSQCGKEFTQYDHLKRHIVNVHNAVKTPCNLCDHQASSKATLVRHIRRVHFT